MSSPIDENFEIVPTSAQECEESIADEEFEVLERFDNVVHTVFCLSIDEDIENINDQDNMVNLTTLDINNAISTTTITTENDASIQISPLPIPEFDYTPIGNLFPTSIEDTSTLHRTMTTQLDTNNAISNTTIITEIDVPFEILSQQKPESDVPIANLPQLTNPVPDVPIQHESQQNPVPDMPIQFSYQRISAFDAPTLPSPQPIPQFGTPIHLSPLPNPEYDGPIYLSPLPLPEFDYTPVGNLFEIAVQPFNIKDNTLHRSTTTQLDTNNAIPTTTLITEIDVPTEIVSDEHEVQIQAEPISKENNVPSRTTAQSTTFVSKPTKNTSVIVIESDSESFNSENGENGKTIEEASANSIIIINDTDTESSFTDGDDDYYEANCDSYTLAAYFTAQSKAANATRDESSSFEMLYTSDESNSHSWQESSYEASATTDTYGNAEMSKLACDQKPTVTTAQPTAVGTTQGLDYNTFCHKSGSPRMGSTPTQSNQKSKTRCGRVVQQRFQLSFDDEDKDVNTTGESDEDYVDDDNVDKNNSFNDTFNTDKSKTKNRTNGCLSRYEIYLDLSDIIIRMHPLPPAPVPADNAEEFQLSLRKYLGTISTKRVLYSPQYGMEELELQADKDSAKVSGNVKRNEPLAAPMIEEKTSPNITANVSSKLLLKSPHDLNESALSLTSKNMDAINAESFSAYSAKCTRGVPAAAAVAAVNAEAHSISCQRKHSYWQTFLKKYDNKDNFIKSLYTDSLRELCHPKAECFRPPGGILSADAFSALTNILFDLFNYKIFGCNLKAKTKIIWNKKPTGASKCLNKFSGGGCTERVSVIELNATLIRTGKALVAHLLHEMCHAAAWLFNAESGHGEICTEWLFRAKEIINDLPMCIFDKCARPAHDYIFRCLLCGATAEGTLPLESYHKTRLRCCYCLGPIDFEHTTSTPDPIAIRSFKKPSTGFGKYIKDNYASTAAAAEAPKHSDIMLILSDKFRTLQMQGNGKK